MRTLNNAFQLPNNNFTSLRLTAAVAVLYYHCYPLSYGRGSGIHDPITTLLQKHAGLGLGGLAVGAFFLISGFLVTASFLNRQNLIAFVEARALRILPGLAVAILFCVFIVGLLMTSLPLVDYLSHERTWSFVKKNISLVSGIQYYLPGVFKENSFPNAVNGSLWTLPVEVWMYMWVAIFGALGMLKDRAIFNAVLFVSVLVYIISPETFPITKVDGSIRNPLFFIFGVFLYINKDFVPLNWPVLVGLSILVVALPKSSLSVTIITGYISYIIFFIAFLPSLNTPALDRQGDFSYGIYIYAFPVQQMAAHYIPSISPVGMLSISLPIVVLLAILSWHLVEKPALRLKGKLPLGRRFIDPRVLGKSVS